MTGLKFKNAINLIFKPSELSLNLSILSINLFTHTLFGLYHPKGSYDLRIGSAHTSRISVIMIPRNICHV